jgi:DNA-binding transcriptional regulator YdaS (Cro superfamily)
MDMFLMLLPEKLALIEKLARIRSMSNDQSPIDRAIDKAGGITALARAMNLSGHSVVHQWRLTRVPAEKCPDIEALTGVTCEDLRPDVNWAVLRAPATTAEQGA